MGFLAPEINSASVGTRPWQVGEGALERLPGRGKVTSTTTALMNSETMVGFHDSY